ncbi:hypothetical protein GGI13_001584 [Coemansia sp. RSA 455]|nr:hypothetical protein H4S03_005739 [Coemansia sp. S3946]KAJ2068840.1 hypothetical protein GGI08_000663 [Coemansia sp. S2]KAJ2255514.1 hypothetical protein GGI13_001584 [Coemansia sp. RSA 455]KAJ2346650.1 hypothetical protein GGH92_003505 [Coemansia sp. RSA 2673]KAJ2463845.1 hypothetical protein GGI03_003589 [Coemansia sp. RSA 2337]
MPSKRAVPSRKKRQLLQQEHGPVGVAVPLPYDVLHLVFACLSPATRYDCSRSALLVHAHTLQRMASVSRQWRTVAMPLFYRTIIIDVDEAGFKTRARSSGGNRGVRTNLGLFVGANVVNVVRNMQIVVKGQLQTAHQLARILRRIGLGETVWHRVEKLRIDISGCEFGRSFGRRENGQEAGNALCELLSLALPSLSDIVLLGIGGHIYNTTTHVYQLIAERLYGSKSLRSLRILPGIFPEHRLVRDLRPQVILPINIGRLHVDNRDRGPPLRLPLVLASPLVELSLNHIAAGRIWDSFVVDDGSDGSLVFSRMQSLSLGFRDSGGNPTLVEMLLMIGAGRNMATTGSNAEADDNTTRYLSSTKFGTPLFPSLTKLEIRHFPYDLSQFLSLFATSPISKLTIHISMAMITHEWNLSRFVGLRSLSVRITDRLSLADQGLAIDCLSILFYSVNSNVQALNLEMSLCRGFEFKDLGIDTLEENLVSLTLKCEIDVAELELLLCSFSNLRRLILHSVISELIPSTWEMYRILRSPDAEEMLVPTCESLQFLQADGLRYYDDDDPSDLSYESRSTHTLTYELALYRGLLLNFVCTMPSLTTLQVRATSLEGVRECIQGLVDCNVAPDFLGHLRSLKVQAIDD